MAQLEIVARPFPVMDSSGIPYGANFITRMTVQANVFRKSSGSK